MTKSFQLPRLLACLCALGALLALAFSLSFTQPAYADDGYVFSIDASQAPASLNVGDTFTVNEVLSKAGDDGFTMYAISTRVGYDSSKLQLVSTDSSSGTVSLQDGAIVYNVLAPRLAGSVWDSPTVLCSLTFEVIGEGDSTLAVSKVGVSSYSGMSTMPVTASGAAIRVASTQPAVESDPSAGQEGSTDGTATGSDVGSDSKDAYKKNVQADYTSAYGDSFTPDDLAELHKAGFTNEELVEMGFNQQDIDAVASGKTVTMVEHDSSDTVLASNSTNTMTERNTAAKSNPLPIVPIVAILIVLAVAVVVVCIVLKRKNRI